MTQPMKPQSTTMMSRARDLAQDHTTELSAIASYCGSVDPVDGLVERSRALTEGAVDRSMSRQRWRLTA